MTAAIEPRADLPALTGLRGIAAWFVVLFHIRTGLASELPPQLIAIFSKGYLAVDLFFMLSGFVLWLNYSDRLRSHGLGATPLFLARRLARIWPLHLFMLGCTIAYALLRLLSGHGDPDHYPWSELPLHFLLVQNWGFTQSLSWNDPAWSISCEFAAYLLFPLLVLAIDWRRLSTMTLAAILLLLAGGLYLIMASAQAATLGSDIARLGLPRAVVEFVMGTIVCALWWRFRNTPRWPIWTSFGLAAAFLLLMLCAGLSEMLGVPLLFAALLLGISLAPSGQRNPLSWRSIHYLGEISYATYLVHFLLYIAFKHLFVDDPGEVPIPLLGLFLLMVLAASVLLHHYLERPAQRALNRAFDSWRPFARLSSERA